MWLSCIAYYITKGHSLNELLSLSDTERTFFIASMELMSELENKRLESLFGALGG